MKNKSKAIMIEYALEASIKVSFKSVLGLREKEGVFYAHKHEDYQIFCIHAAFLVSIGDTVYPLKKGDILVIGKNVPHSINYIDDPLQKLDYSALGVIHFKQSLFPINMHEIGEFEYIRKLLVSSSQGIVFQSEGIFKRLTSKLRFIDRTTGIGRVSTLFSLLEMLGKTNDYKVISPYEFNIENKAIGFKSAIQKTFDYIYDNFDQNITLEQISTYASQNSTALCRNFKNETGQTIFQFINKLRVNHTCKLLLETEMTVSEIAYLCGYLNLAHFYRQFKLLKQQSPNEYRKVNKSPQ
ncbi:AraC family transcriptional regulator [Myroides odoratimimus]|uniref:AraC family transcriptional regulator n=1 Tax=Myroides odoratimimus TaxID=76832 RepID=UPI0031016819